MRLSGHDGNPVSVDMLMMEDIVLDRLNAAAWWAPKGRAGESEDFVWAKALILIGGESLDRNALRRRAETENELSGLLEKAFSEADEIKDETEKGPMR
ncbi:hypothetical protein KAR29_05615 [Aminithiophilus ramosus]|uniref:Uncharacterized protein n=2 Tax=Synergistales TaxID=649776 RepID=A0A9Q7AKT6_9BACT|nr:hypothetical protein [Aminithiophilus ramosus]QTX33350.1 hypothetical protein KAR29_05615 [Aminithiophilus ramosus]QVL36902.1 hypothetical protein KIH16_03745 [Synergistota bacterium]